MYESLAVELPEYMYICKRKLKDPVHSPQSGQSFKMNSDFKVLIDFSSQAHFF
jgi:hypothetical protein